MLDSDSAWIPKRQYWNSEDNWVKIDLGRIERVTGVAIQGRKYYTNKIYTTSFNIEYKYNKNDAEWTKIGQTFNTDFNGFVDSQTSYIYLNEPINMSIIK